MQPHGRVLLPKSGSADATAMCRPLIRRAGAEREDKVGRCE